MLITYQPTVDIEKSARFTLDNMSTYYQKYGVNWDLAKIVEQVSELDNKDIVCEGEIIGVLRVSVDGEDFHIRDIQIASHYQNKGIGEQVLAHALELAKGYDTGALKLKVFKVSPAHRLYKRNGFELVSEDDRFYYMSKNVS